MTDEVVKLIGHRLTSLAVIPTTHINGIAAITFTTLQYTPQKYQVGDDHFVYCHLYDTEEAKKNAKAAENAVIHQ